VSTHPHAAAPRWSAGRLVAEPLIWLIRAYQLVLSPLSPPSCRFYPSCSAYAVTALQSHGILRGSRLAVWRLLRCNPWNPGGVDHVPPPKGSGSLSSSDRRPEDH